MQYQIKIGPPFSGGHTNSKLQRFKAFVISFLILSAAIGVFIAALTLGLVIAGVLLVVAAGAILIGLFSYAWRRKAR